MIKLVCLLKKKPGMSREAFVKRYEEGHVPLIEKLLPFYTKYRRSFIIDDEKYEPGHVANAAPPERDFDVITELWFDSRENYEKLLAALADPEIGGLITEDEKDLFDRDKMTMYLLEEFNEQ